MEIGSLSRMDAGAPIVSVNPSSQQGQGSASQETGTLAVARAVEKEVQIQESKGETTQPQQRHLLPTEEELKTMSAAMNRFVQMLSADLQFEVHSQSKQLMVRFVDVRQNKILKEFPSKEFLDMVSSIRDYVGVLVDKKI